MSTYIYIIEIKKNKYTNYTKGKLYLKSYSTDKVHIVMDPREAAHFKKQSLRKIYARFGRNNVVRHIVEPIKKLV